MNKEHKLLMPQSFFLNSATNNLSAFSRIGIFLKLEEIAYFLLINQYFKKITKNLAEEHLVTLHYSESADQKSRIQKIQGRCDDLILQDLFGEKNLNYLRMFIALEIIRPDFVILEQSLIALAIENNSPETVQLLLKKEFKDKIIADNKDGNLITSAFRRESIDIVKMLFPYVNSFPPHLRSRNQSTLLMHAIKDGDIQWVNKLLPDHLAENKPSELLNVAIDRRSYEMAKLLLENGVKIQPPFSPLKILAQRYRQVKLYEHADIPNMFHNFELINNMLTLFIKHGDKIDTVSNSAIRKLFCGGEPVLVRAIISHGGSDEKINIFDILKRLENISKCFNENQDWDTLIFWLERLNGKLPKKEDQFQLLLDKTLETYGECMQTGDLLQDQSRSDNSEEIWQLIIKILNIGKNARKNNDWSHIQSCTTRLTKYARQYFMTFWQERTAAWNKRNRDEEKRPNSSNSSNSFNFLVSPESSQSTDPVNSTNIDTMKLS